MTYDLFLELEKEFHIYTKDADNLLYEIRLPDLLTDEGCQQFIDYYGKCIKSLDNKVQAAYFAGYIGGFCGGVQYLLSQQKTIDFSLSNIVLQLYKNHQYDSVEMCFKLIDTTVKSVSAQENQSQKQIFEAFYGQTVMPLLKLWHLSTDIIIDHLLGQISARLYYFHQQAIEKAETIEQKDRVQYYFDLLIKGIDHKVFNKSYNPFDITFEMIESPWNPKELLRMKKSCCLYYLTEGATCKCYTCPEMTEEERLIRKKEILGEPNL